MELSQGFTFFGCRLFEETPGCESLTEDDMSLPMKEAYRQMSLFLDTLKIDIFTQEVADYTQSTLIIKLLRGQSHGTSKHDGFEYCLMYGNLEFVQLVWPISGLCKHLTVCPLEAYPTYQELYYRIVRKCTLEVLQWLHSVFPITKNFSQLQLIRGASENPNALEMCKWIDSTIEEIIKKDGAADMDRIRKVLVTDSLKTIIAFGSEEVAMWMIEGKYIDWGYVSSIHGDNYVLSEDNRLFTYAFESGMIRVCKYLYGMHHVSASDEKIRGCIEDCDLRSINPELYTWAHTIIEEPIDVPMLIEAGATHILEYDNGSNGIIITEEDLPDNLPLKSYTWLKTHNLLVPVYRSIFVTACQYGNFKVIDAVINDGYEVKDCIDEGFAVAFCCGLITVLKYLVNYGVSKNAIVTAHGVAIKEREPKNTRMIKYLESLL
jgi:hypothetical protein